MSANKELLNDIYQNAEMGLLTIPKLISVTKDPDFIRVLQTQLEEYRDISKKARDLMAQKNLVPEEVGEFAKLRSKLMTEFMTMTDSSVSHLAEMMVQGNTMGATGVTRRIHEHKGADAEVMDLANRLKKTADANTEQIKKFL